MDLRVLGAVEVYAGARAFAVGRPQQAMVFAALIAEAGRPVPVEALVDRIWGEAPPPQARRIVHTHVARLRRLLAHVSALDGVPAAVTRCGGGYLLEVPPGSVDLNRFRELVSRSGTADCSATRRAGLLREALDLWRGEAMAGLSGEWVERVRQAWARERLHAVVEWAGAELDRGTPATALPQLAELVGEHPLVESLAAAYLRALYAAGHQADALRHYATIRHRLADELGTDPGPELQQLHRQILSADPALVAPAAATAPERLVPRQLPAPPQLFTGRAAELAIIDQIPVASTVVITAIDGMAGIGKTALAIHAAHRIAGRYPDGQLFIDLHGYTRGMDPVEPGEALHHLLRAQGIPGAQIPAGLDQRAALYRTRLADRRMLIVLDNAVTEAQVAPLLPGSGGSLVLVTSRRRLTGLDHSYTLSLDTLLVPDAVELFSRTAGDGRLAGEPIEQSAELIDLCGRLPLAIRIAAARLRSHPSWSLSHLVARLRDRQHRLGELEAGQRSVTAALDLSYRQLPADQQRVYRLLGAHPGPDIDPYATAALLDCTVALAGRLLDQLNDAHLLHEPTPGRYRFHDLTRAHAAGIAAGDQPGTRVLEELDRLLDYYRHTTAAAMDAAYPYERAHRPPVPPAGSPAPALPHPPAALAWLDTELPNLLAAADYATDHGRPEYVLHLSSTLQRDLAARGRHTEAGSLHHQALVTARGLGHQVGELDALIGLGQVHMRQSRYPLAIDHFEQALRIARETGNRVGELTALSGLGDTYWMQGRHEPAGRRLEQARQIARAIGHGASEIDALSGLGHLRRMQGRYEQSGEHFDRVLRIAREIGHRAGEMTALSGLGHLHWMQGRYEQSGEHFDKALRIAREVGHRVGEMAALSGLGHLRRMQGRYEQSGEHFDRVLRIARETGHRVGEMAALLGHADAHRRQGRYQPADGYYRQLHDLVRATGDRNFEFEARQGLGRLRHATGEPDAAISQHRRALALARELGQALDEARAHDGLAQAQHALNQPERARSHWQAALDILTDRRVDHAEDGETTVATIRASLARLNDQTSRD